MMRNPSVALYIQPISAIQGDERLLSVAERNRAARFTGAPARLAFIAGRTAIRRVLGRILGCAPDEVTIFLSDTGRPELDLHRHPEGISFSLSHSDRSIALGVGANRVGVDIETEGRRVDFANLTRRILGANEAGLAQRMSVEKAIFLSVWTAKEAAAKAVGTGLRFDPRRFQLSGHPDPDGTPMAVRFPNNSEVWVRTIVVAGEICSVASTESGFELDLQMTP